MVLWIYNYDCRVILTQITNKIKATTLQAAQKLNYVNLCSVLEGITEMLRYVQVQAQNISGKIWKKAVI